VALGGWIVSLERFTRIEVRQGSALAGAGVLLRDLHSAARASGQFYPPDPTETAASLGGSIATNASGSRSFRYGATRRHIQSVRVIMMDGVARTFRRGEAVDFTVPAIAVPRGVKHSAGYALAPGMDWVDLFVGSEGTLGIVTEAEVNLLPAPAALLAGVVFLRDDEAAVDAVDAWRGVPGNRMLEYFDRPSLQLLAQRFSEIPANAGAAILFEQELNSANDPEIDLWEPRLESVGADPEASWFAMADSDRERFRKFRHTLPEMVNDIVRRDGFAKIGSDYSVPVERNREMLGFYRMKLNAEFPGRAVIFGHIGNAHLHANILPASQEEFDRARALMLEFARRAVELGGSVAAEHGLGKRKIHLLALQYTDAEIEAMKAVKLRLDPQWLLGRGNLFEPYAGRHSAPLAGYP
jgi:FAD/FMN-containing dehydrogenase